MGDVSESLGLGPQENLLQGEQQPPVPELIVGLPIIRLEGAKGKEGYIDDAVEVVVTK